MTAISIWPGSLSPLGATFNGGGVNFSLFSEHATKVKLCLAWEHLLDSGRVSPFQSGPATMKEPALLPVARLPMYP
jgi:pullulanase/glycogen debranching enzyme